MKPSPAYAPRHTRKARRWVARLASGECSARELERLRAWLERDPRHRAAFEQQRRFWQSLEPAREPVLAAWPELLDAPASRTVRRPPWRPLFAAAMAVLVLAWLAPGGWLLLRADHRSGVAPLAFTLADGTAVSLDADSAIAVHYDRSERRIELLRGRAWFHVVHEPARAFRVDALGGSSRDIGTAFAVGVRDGEVRTAVGEGEVEVSSGTRWPGMRVRAGEWVGYRRDGPVSAATALSPDNVGAWRRGEILLVDVDGRSAIERIALYRRAPVWVLGDIGAHGRITAAFRTDRPEQAIHAVAAQLQLEVRPLPGGALLLHPMRR